MPLNERARLSRCRENINGAGAAGGGAGGGLGGLDDEEDEAFLRWAAENPDAEELRFPEDGAAARGGAAAQPLEPGILRARPHIRTPEIP